MSKRSAKAARTSSSSSQSQPSPKRNCARLNSDEMELNEENVTLRQILDKLANMDDRIEEHFGSLTAEEVETIKTNLKSVEQSLQSAWDNINDLQAESKTHSDFKRTSQQTLDSFQEEINLLKRNSASAVIQNQQAEIRALHASLEKEKEKIIALENYSRRENLRFMNIPERKDENCFDVVYDIIENGLCFLCFGRMSSPPVGLVQWLSDLTSNPNRDRGMPCLKKGSPQTGGAPSRQLRRGIEPRLHRLRQKKQKASESAKAHTTETSNPRSRPTKDTKREEATKR